MLYLMTPHQDGRPHLSTFWRYVRVQAFVFLCGIVGPIFLVVYFAAQPEPTLKWMYWAGLFITAADVLIALALTNAANRPPMHASRPIRPSAGRGFAAACPSDRLFVEGSIPSSRRRHHVVHHWAAGSAGRILRRQRPRPFFYVRRPPTCR